MVKLLGGIDDVFAVARDAVRPAQLAGKLAGVAELAKHIAAEVQLVESAGNAVGSIAKATTK